MPNSVTIRTTAPGATQAATDLDKVKNAVLGIGTASGGAFQQLGKAGLAIGSSVLIADKIGDVAKTFGEFLGDAAAAALEEQKNVAKLNQSLKDNVKDWDGSTASIEAHISKLEDLGFSDDDLRDSLARIVAVTKDVDTAFEGVGLAADIARFKNIDLGDAATIVARIYAGDYNRALKSVGIEIGTVHSKTEALDALQRLVGGQAVAYAETTAGAIDTMNIKFEDANEELGAHLLPTLDRASSFVISDVIPAFSNLSDTFGGFIDLIGGGASASAVEDFFTQIPEEIRNLIPGMGEVGAGLGTKVAEESAAKIVLGIQAKAADIIDLYRDLATDSGDASEEEFDQAGFDSAVAFADSMVAEIHDKIDTFNESARGITNNMADTLRDGAKNEIKDAMADLTWAIEHPLALLKQTALVESKLTSEKLLAGLASKNPEIKAQAEQTQQRLIEIWEQLTGEAYSNGVSAGNALEQGIRAGYDPPHLAAPTIGGYDDPGRDPGHKGPGGKAGGGPVQANTAYIVGEEGPELFRPNTNGTIIPHSQMNQTTVGPSSIAVHVNLSTRNFANSQQHYARLQPVGGF